MRIWLVLAICSCSQPEEEAAAPEQEPSKAPVVKLTVTGKPNWETGIFDLDIAHDYGQPGKFRFDGPSFRTLGHTVSADAKHGTDRQYLREIDGGKYEIRFESEDGRASATAEYTIERKPEVTMYDTKADVTVKADWDRQFYNAEHATLGITDGKLALGFMGPEGARATIAGKQVTLTGKQETIEIELAPLLLGEIPKSRKLEIPVKVIAKSGGARIDYPITIDGVALVDTLFRASKGKGFRIPGEVPSRNHGLIGADADGEAPKVWSDFDRIVEESETSVEASPCRYTVADGPEKGKPFTVYRKITTSTLRLLDRRTGAVLRQQAFRGKLAPCPARRFEIGTESSVTDKTYDDEGRKRFIAGATR